MQPRTQTNTAFGNGAFGSSRPTMARSSPLRPCAAYVPPSQRQGVMVNEANFPALGTPPPKKMPVADPGRPSLLKVVSDRATADAEAMAAKAEAGPLEEAEPAMFFPPGGRFLQRVAEREAREARMRDERDMELLYESSSFFRALMNQRSSNTHERNFQPAWLSAHSSAPETWESPSAHSNEESDGYKSGDSDYL